MKSIAVVLMSLYCILLAGCDKGKKPYEEAETLFKKSEYATAKAKAQEVIQNAPNSKYLPQASAILEKVEKIESLSKVAAASIEDGDYEKGISTYQEILMLVPNEKTTTENIALAKKVLSEVKESKSDTVLNAKDSQIIINVKKADYMRDEAGKKLPSSGLYIPFIEFTIENKRDKAIKLTSVKTLHAMVTDIDLLAKIEPMYIKVLDEKTLPLNIIVPSGKSSKSITAISEYGSRRNTYIGDRFPTAIIAIGLQTNEGYIAKQVGIHWNEKERTYAFHDCCSNPFIMR